VNVGTQPFGKQHLALIHHGPRRKRQRRPRGVWRGRRRPAWARTAPAQERRFGRQL